LKRKEAVYYSPHRLKKIPPKTTKFRCIHNCHFDRLRDFQHNKFLNKKFISLINIINKLEVLENQPLLQEGYLSKAHKIWRHWTFYFKERFAIWFAFCTNHFPISLSSSRLNFIDDIKKEFIYNWAATIDRIKATVGIVLYISIDYYKNRFSYSLDKIKKLGSDSRDWKIARTFFKEAHNKK